MSKQAIALLIIFLGSILTIFVSFFSDLSNQEMFQRHRPEILTIADTTHKEDTLIRNSHSLARGCFHGFIAVGTGIVSLVNNENIIYESNRNPGWYLIGFIFGILTIVAIVYFFTHLPDESGTSNSGGSDDDHNDDWIINPASPTSLLNPLNPASPISIFR